MAESSVSRRNFLVSAGLACGTLATAANAASTAEAAVGDGPSSFRHCLNTGTIRGQKLSIEEQINVTAKAGYDAIEPWTRDIDEYQKAGGSLVDLRKRIEDSGLTVESAIGFSRWIAEDEQVRMEGLEQARREMDLLKQIGGKRIAAPPSGATKEPLPDLFAAAARYRALLEIGAEIGITPQIEVWGFSKSLSRLGESTLVAIESGHPDACVLADVYHLYKGGSSIYGLKLLSGKAMQVFHVNDYPTSIPPEKITDADRVYPGDGDADYKTILRILHDVGFRGYLSLELFNREYWKQDALTVARTGLEKTKQVVAAAFA